MQQFTKNNYHELCDVVATTDHRLKNIISNYEYPPLWVRPNTFETLVLTILEQQVSLASAYSAYKKLKEKLNDISPTNFLKLTDEELRSCYFSRQKIIYTRELATAIHQEQINLKTLVDKESDNVRTELMKIKGIGNWTVDIYLIHVLQRTDIFPIGDLAAVNAIKMLLQCSSINKEEIIKITDQWKPYRSIATMILWHYYIKERNIKLLH